VILQIAEARRCAMAINLLLGLIIFKFSPVHGPLTEKNKKIMKDITNTLKIIIKD